MDLTLVLPVRQLYVGVGAEALFLQPEQFHQVGHPRQYGSDAAIGA